MHVGTHAPPRPVCHGACIAPSDNMDAPCGAGVACAVERRYDMVECLHSPGGNLTAHVIARNDVQHVAIDVLRPL